MADELEKQANAAFVDEDFDLAVELFSKAISADPDNASLFARRAQAHIKLQNHTDAVADANRAIELNPSLSKAYLRKGIACYSLEEFQTAKAAFVAGAALEATNSSFKTWIQKCDDALAEEAATTGDYSVVKVHPVVSASPMDPNGVTRDESAPLAVTNLASRSETLTSASSPTPAPLAPPASKFRHAFYENANANEVVVTIFAKGVRTEDVQIEFGEQFLSVVITIPQEDPYVLQHRLYGKIVVPQCKYTILSTKIEIRLVKAENIQWKSLQYDEKQAVVQHRAVSRDVVETKLEYPSSSKKGHKDWDKMEAEVKKQEKDENLEGDAALNKLFRDIYRNADEDTRRAMNKSFVESNGTVLSTNWKDVGSKYVEGSPPTGMEMRKWEQ